MHEIPTAPEGFEEVTVAKFYEVIGPQDATVSCQGNWPYTSEFKLRHNHKVLGKVVGYFPTEFKYPTASKYFLAKT